MMGVVAMTSDDSCLVAVVLFIVLVLFLGWLFCHGLGGGVVVMALGGSVVVIVLGGSVIVMSLGGSVVVMVLGGVIVVVWRWWSCGDRELA